MTENCKKLSPGAWGIFKKIKAYFPRDPWNKPRWRASGKVEDNGWYDLRKNEDRNKLIDLTRDTLGSMVEVVASVYRKENGSMNGFEHQHFSMMIQHKAELLLLLVDLDHQIETIDLVESF